MCSDGSDLFWPFKILSPATATISDQDRIGSQEVAQHLGLDFSLLEILRWIQNWFCAVGGSIIGKLYLILPYNNIYIYYYREIIIDMTFFFDFKGWDELTKIKTTQLFYWLADEADDPKNK